MINKVLPLITCGYFSHIHIQVYTVNIISFNYRESTAPNSMMIQQWLYLVTISPHIHLSCFYISKYSPVTCGTCVGSYDSSVRVWDSRSHTYEPIQVMNDAKDSVTSLQLSSSEILTGCVYYRPTPHHFSVCALILCRSVDGKVRRYDLRFGKLYCDTIAS